MARRCGHCSSFGHNVRTCGDLTRALERRRREYLARDESSVDPEGSIERLQNLRRLQRVTDRLAKRTGVHPVTGSKVAKRILSRPRRCSYCRAEGHTRRTCSIRNGDQAVYREATRIARQAIVERIMATDIGIGTLCVHRLGYYDSKKDWHFGDRPCIITKVLWSEYTYDSHSFQFEITPAAMLLGGGTQHARSVGAQHISLSMLENNLREEGGKPVTPAGALSFSEEWLSASDIDWKRIAGFAGTGAPRHSRFETLESAYSREWAPQILAMAYNNLQKRDNQSR